MKNTNVLAFLSLFAITTLGGCNASPQASEVIINVSNNISLKEGATYQI